MTETTTKRSGSAVLESKAASPEIGGGAGGHAVAAPSRSGGAKGHGKKKEDPGAAQRAARKPPAGPKTEAGAEKPGRKPEKAAKHKPEKQGKAEKMASKKKSDRPGPGDNPKIEFDSSMPREEAVAYFEAIVAGLKTGTIQFKQGEERAVLSPPAYLDVTVKAKQKHRKEKVTFEISWRTHEDETLSVTSK